MSGGQRWSDIPAWRRWLIHVIIATGIGIGVLIAMQGEEVRASAMGSIAIFANALCMLLLALIFAALLYDSVA